MNWSAEPGTEPGLFSAALWRVALSCTSRASACLLQEKTEAVGVLLDPWVFPPAMTHRSPEDGSAWSRDSTSLYRCSLSSHLGWNELLPLLSLLVVMSVNT